MTLLRWQTPMSAMGFRGAHLLLGLIIQCALVRVESVWNEPTACAPDFRPISPTQSLDVVCSGPPRRCGRHYRRMGSMLSSPSCVRGQELCLCGQAQGHPCGRAMQHDGCWTDGFSPEWNKKTYSCSRSAVACRLFTASVLGHALWRRCIKH